MTPLGSSGSEDRSSAPGGHPLSESVVLGSLTAIRLERSLHNLSLSELVTQVGPARPGSGLTSRPARPGDPRPLPVGSMLGAPRDSPASDRPFGPPSSATDARGC